MYMTQTHAWRGNLIERPVFRSLIGQMNWGTILNLKLDARTSLRRKQKACRDMCVNGIRACEILRKDSLNERKVKKV